MVDLQPLAEPIHLLNKRAQEPICIADFDEHYVGNVFVLPAQLPRHLKGDKAAIAPSAQSVGSTRSRSANEFNVFSSHRFDRCREMAAIDTMRRQDVDWTVFREISCEFQAVVSRAVDATVKNFGAVRLERERLIDNVRWLALVDMDNRTQDVVTPN